MRTIISNNARIEGELERNRVIFMTNHPNAIKLISVKTVTIELSSIPFRAKTIPGMCCNHPNW
jgi:hypothetical protein